MTIPAPHGDSEAATDKVGGPDTNAGNVVAFNRATRGGLVRSRIWGGQPETTTTLDLTALLELLGYTPDEYVSLNHDGGGVWQTAVVKAANAADYFAMIPDTANTYFGVNPIAGPARTGAGRGTADDVTRLSSLWADLDVKAGGCGDTATTQAIIDDLSELLGERPAAITHSGNGLHPYWLVCDGEVDTATLTALVNRWGRLVKAAAKRHGAKADSVFDLARVLRAPGSFNCKAATNGHGGIPVRTVPDTGRPLKLADIDELLSSAGVHEAPDDREQREQLPTPDTWQFVDETCPYVAAMIDGWEDADTIDPGTGRHQWLLSQCVRLHCAIMCGCITEPDYDRARGILERQMEHLCASREPIRSVPSLEIPGALVYGTDKAATKTAEEARTEELAGHEHGKGKRSQATLLADLAELDPVKPEL